MNRSVRRLRAVAASASGRSAAAIIVALAIAAPAALSQTSLRRLEPPPEGQAYFGLTLRMWDTTDPVQRDARPVDVRLADAVAHDLGGRAPTFFAIDTSFPTRSAPGEIPAVEIRAAQRHAGSSLAVVNWFLGGSNAACGVACYHDYTSKDVADGTLDAYLRRAAIAYRQLATPVLIWLMPDANTRNHPGITALGPTSLAAADYRTAWRHVVDVFRQEGAGNVSFAWVIHDFPSIGAPDPNVDRAIASYYPGDRYVDWIGSDTYDREPIDYLEAPYAFAVSRAKPFILAGFVLRSHPSLLDPEADVGYLSSVFDWFESHPDVRAIDYLDKMDSPATQQELAPPSVSLDDGQVSYLPWSATGGYDDEDDGRLLADDGVQRSAAFAGRIANPRYVSNISTAPATTHVSLPDISSLSVGITGAQLRMSWRGDALAQSYDLELRQPGHAWRELLKGAPQTSDTLGALLAGRYQVRVRAHDVIGSAGPWSVSRTLHVGS
jgi:hypothetical protein